MPLPELEESQLDDFRTQLQDVIRQRSLPFGNLKVTQDVENFAVQVEAIVFYDPLMAAGRDQPRNRSVALVKLFAESEPFGREVLFAQLRFAVSKDESYFSPVPAEYGDEVSIEFSWEFERETLTPGCAEVRDRGSLHYASVLPNEHFSGFVRCCAQVAENWFD